MLRGSNEYMFGDRPDPPLSRGVWRITANRTVGVFQRFQREHGKAMSTDGTSVYKYKARYRKCDLIPKRIAWNDVFRVCIEVRIFRVILVSVQYYC